MFHIEVDLVFEQKRGGVEIKLTNAYLIVQRLIVLVFGLLLSCSLDYSQQYGWVKVVRLPHALATIDFKDFLHGWTADNTTGFYYTKDGGVNWQQGSGATVVPYSISMYDTLIGWASGWSASAGAVSKTTDGGISWVEQKNVNDRHYVGIAALTKSRSIATGYFFNSGMLDTGKLLRTFDGGVMWNEQTLADSIAELRKIQFVDSLHGWISAGLRNSLGAIIQTSDGGNTWNIFPTPQNFNAISFIDTLRGWGAYSSLVYHTVDGGKNWKYVADIFDPDPWASDHLTTNALSFLDSLNGWAFGGITDSGIITEGIYRTTDGGSNWYRESIHLTGDFGVVNDGKVLDLYHRWAVCNDGSILELQTVTGVVEKLPDLPQALSLHQNYPNPFNPTTNIKYEIMHREYVTLTVYNAIGEKISILVNQLQDPAVYRIIFDGSTLPSGIYHYQLRAGKFLDTKKMLLIR